jgi:hypothetical protein
MPNLFASSFIAAILLTSTAHADPGFVVTSTTGQANFSSCQSYALAVALAFKRDPAFPITTWAELRKTELGIRGKIEAVRNARDPKSDVNHDDISAGFLNYTAAKHRLVRSTADLTALGQAVASRSGVSTAASVPASFLLGATVKDVLLSSATQIEGYSYKSGHIFTILGVDGPPNSDQRYLVLNSAAKKGAQTVVTCQDGLPDDPGPYQASLAWVKVTDITLKAFGDNKFSLWKVE